MELIATIMIFTSARYCKSKSKNCFIYYTFMFFVITLLLSLLEHSNNTYTELTSKIVPNVVYRAQIFSNEIFFQIFEYSVYNELVKFLWCKWYVSIRDN